MAVNHKSKEDAIIDLLDKITSQNISTLEKNTDILHYMRRDLREFLKKREDEIFLKCTICGLVIGSCITTIILKLIL